MSSNFGVCLYRQGGNPGELEADWYEHGLTHGKRCRGVAKGGPEEGFEGSYHVTYLDADDQPVITLDLDICADGDVFRLAWRQGGRTACIGLGLATGDGLAVAYRVEASED